MSILKDNEAQLIRLVGGGARLSGNNFSRSFASEQEAASWAIMRGYVILPQEPAPQPMAGEITGAGNAMLQSQIRTIPAGKVVYYLKSRPDNGYDIHEADGKRPEGLLHSFGDRGQAVGWVMRQNGILMDEEGSQIYPFINKSKQGTAADVLAEAAATFRERNAQYKSNYLMVGPMVKILFPDGVPPEVVSHHSWHLFELILVKLSRFAISNLTHQDSIRDATVYAAMIESIIINKE